MTKVTVTSIDRVWMEIIGDRHEITPEECPNCGSLPLLTNQLPEYPAAQTRPGYGQASGAWVCYCIECDPRCTAYGWDSCRPWAAVAAWNERVRATREYRAEHAQDPPQCAECQGEGSYLLFNHRHLCGACGGSGY